LAGFEYHISSKSSFKCAIVPLWRYISAVLAVLSQRGTKRPVNIFNYWGVTIQMVVEIQGQGTEKPKGNMLSGPLPAFTLPRILKMGTKRFGALISIWQTRQAPRASMKICWK
jgi:hypothetical protein